MMRIFTLWIALLGMAASAHGEVYKWVDDQGTVHFGDRQPSDLEANQLDIKVNTHTGVNLDAPVDDVEKKAATDAKQVIMYATGWCGYCAQARKYFKENKIPYTEYDIEKSPQAKRRYKKLGATGVPVIIVGSRRMHGFSVEGFKRIYR